VQPWAIVGQPRKYAQRDGADIDVGWAWDLAHTTERRLVRIEVAKGHLGRSDLPDECKRAIRDRGRSAVSAHLDADDPPSRIVVTSAGLMVEYR